MGNLGGDAKREFGMAVIEALASGTPVVAMWRGAMPVVIRHGEKRLPGHRRARVQALPAAGRRAPARGMLPSVKERFSAAEMAGRYVARYEEVLERAG